jgi:hypothetical protein
MPANVRVMMPANVRVMMPANVRVMILANSHTSAGHSVFKIYSS